MALIPCEAFFGPSWLASVSLNTLKQNYRPEHILNLNISEICEKHLAIMHRNNGGKRELFLKSNDYFPRSYLPLRLHSKLLLGTARIFEQQVNKLLAECAHLCFMSQNKSKSQNLNSGRNKKNLHNKKSRGLASTNLDNQHNFDDQSNLAGQYFSHLMQDCYAKLMSEASQPIVINNNVNVQIHQITLKETEDPMCLSSNDLMAENEDSFDNTLNADIKYFNDDYQISNDNNLFSCDGDERKDKSLIVQDYSPSTSLNQQQVQIYRPISTHVSTQNQIKVECNRKRKLKNCKTKFYKKRRFNAVGDKHSSSPRILKSANAIKRHHTPTNFLSIEEDDILPNKRILKEIDCNVMNSNEMSHNESSKSVSKFNEEYEYEQQQPNILEETYIHDMEKWNPAGVFKMLYSIWRAIPNEVHTLQMIDAKVFLAAADSRLCGALGFSSLLALAKSHLVRIITYENSIEVRYLYKGTLFDVFCKKI